MFCKLKMFWLKLNVIDCCLKLITNMLWFHVLWCLCCTRQAEPLNPPLRVKENKHESVNRQMDGRTLPNYLPASWSINISLGPMVTYIPVDPMKLFYHLQTFSNGTAQFRIRAIAFKRVRGEVTGKFSDPPSFIIHFCSGPPSFIIYFFFKSVLKVYLYPLDW